MIGSGPHQISKFSRLRRAVYKGGCVILARRRRENFGGSRAVYKGKCNDFARRRREKNRDLGAYTRGNVLILLAAGSKILDLNHYLSPPLFQIWAGEGGDK